jgi:hypothetical protein
LLDDSGCNVHMYKWNWYVTCTHTTSKNWVPTPLKLINNQIHTAVRMY